jgi:uncharacterized delta-60 repeat protein
VTVRTAVLVLSAVGIASGWVCPAQAAERPGRLDATIATLPGDRIEAMDVAGAERIVTAGRSSGYPLNHPWVRTYLASGGPDLSFGENGTVLLEDDRRVVVKTIVQPDGRVIVVQSGQPYDQSQPHLIRRLTPDGEPDVTFAGTGSFQPDLRVPNSRMTDMALQPDGRLVVVGVGAESSVAPVVLVVARYMPDGSPDPSFGSGGVSELPVGGTYGFGAVAHQARGTLVLTAVRDGVPLITRLSPGGVVDASFGSGGLAPVEYGRARWADDVRVAAGRVPVLVGAKGQIRIAVEFTRPRHRGYRMGLVGLTANGHPSARFGGDGRALGPIPGLPVAGESAQTAVFDRRGGILLAGGLWEGAEFAFDSHTVIRRFRADGSPDRSFGVRGAVRGPPPKTGYPVFLQQLAFLDEDTLVVAETEFDGKYAAPASGSSTLRTFHAGYDDRAPRISIVVQGCRSLRVRVTDLSGLLRTVVRAPRRVLHRTTRKRFSLRLPRRTRVVSVGAIDLAENVSTRRVRLPGC